MPLLARATQYSRLLRDQFVIRDWWRQFFERYDLLLTPMLPFVAYSVDQAQPTGHLVANYFSRSFNQTGQPAASIPCGLTTDNLPVGLQVVASLGDEARLIAAMRVIEAALPRCQLRLKFMPPDLPSRRSGQTTGSGEDEGYRGGCAASVRMRLHRSGRASPRPWFARPHNGLMG